MGRFTPSKWAYVSEAVLKSTWKVLFTSLEWDGGSLAVTYQPVPHIDKPTKLE